LYGDQPRRSPSAKLQKLGLVPVIALVLLSDQQTAIVESLDPPAGELVEAGKQIMVTPVDRPLVEVRDVRGFSLEVASQELVNHGLVPEEAPVALSDFATAVVGSTEPEQGIPVRAGKHVLIFLIDTTL
jgi:beta-lactam-binding protein with PASTA domain